MVTGILAIEVFTGNPVFGYHQGQGEVIYSQCRYLCQDLHLREQCKIVEGGQASHIKSTISAAVRSHGAHRNLVNTTEHQIATATMTDLPCADCGNGVGKEAGAMGRSCNCTRSFKALGKLKRLVLSLLTRNSAERMTMAQCMALCRRILSASTATVSDEVPYSD